MAKRFTDTDKWKKPFIRGLEAPYKLLWFYILDECDHAGIWQVDFEVAKIKIGEKLHPDKALSQLGEKIYPFDNNEKWFVPEFIKFQYGELNPENRAHKSVIAILQENSLIQNNALVSPLQGAKDKDKEQDKDKEKEGTAIKKFIPPTVEQVIEYFKLNGFSETGARKAHEHYNLADWHDTEGKPVKNWKQKVHTVWFKPEYKELKPEDTPFLKRVII